MQAVLSDSSGLCDAGEMNLGKSVIYDEPIDVLDGKKILFFPHREESVKFIPYKILV